MGGAVEKKLTLYIVQNSLILVAVIGIPTPKSKKEWQTLFVMGMLNNVVPFSLIVWGQTQIPSGLASILNATVPLFTVVLAGLLLPDEPFTPGKLTGAFVGLVGTICMVGPSMSSGLGGDVIAQLAIIGAAISYGFAGIFGRRNGR